MSSQPPDIDRLIAEVAARHGVLLKRDDAAFALVTLNQLMLEQALAGAEARIRNTITELDSSTARVQAQVGRVIASEVAEALARFKSELQIPRRSLPEPSRRQEHRTLLLISGAAVFALGVALGMLFR